MLITTDDTKDSDVAILKLQSPLNFGPFVAPACLPPSSNFDPENDGNRIATVSGWGLIKDSKAIQGCLKKWI